MGKVTIQSSTTKKPITLAGLEAGTCWGADTTSEIKNYRRGINCLKSNHGRVLEFPQIYLTIEGYSARVIREYYTHIGGSPTRLQESTRYVDCGEFDYIIPPSINTKEKLAIYLDAMNQITISYKELLNLSVPKEDIANLLPLGMTTKIVVRTNLRQLIDMSHQRLCNRAYWEFRKLIKDILKELKEYSDEWKEIVDNYCVPKCKSLGFCPEEHSCGASITFKQMQEEKEFWKNHEDDMK